MSLGILPGELVLYILEIAAGGELRGRHAIRMSHVDRWWRELALSTKSLWSVIDSRLGPSCAREFVQRAHPVGLDIRVYEPGAAGDSLSSTQWAELQAIVLHEAYTWSRLTIDASTPDILSAILGGFFSPNEPTRTVDDVVLRVTVDQSRYTLADRSQTPGFPFHCRAVEVRGYAGWQHTQLAPTLQRLVIRDLAPPVLVSKWYTAPNVTERTPDILALAQTLRNAHNLRELVLDGSGPATFTTSSIQTITLSHLRSLTIMWTGAAVACQVIALLSVPALQSLRLHLVDGDDFVWNTIATLSNPGHLEELAVSFAHILPQQIHKPAETDPLQLDKYRGLKILVLEATGIGNASLRTLARLPLLRHLELRYEPNISADCVKELVATRQASDSVCGLQALEVDSCPQLKPHDASALAGLVSELRWYVEDEDDASEYEPPDSAEESEPWEEYQSGDDSYEDDTCSSQDEEESVYDSDPE